MLDKDKSIKGVAADAVSTTLEESTSLALENLPTLAAEVGSIIGNSAVNTVIQSITSGVVGAIAPGAFSALLTFQQKRFERNVEKWLQKLVNEQEIIWQRLDSLSAENRQKFIDGPYRDALLENILYENQNQKVSYNINGYINLMAVKNSNDDIVFTFFHTLSEMNELDIRVLRIYAPSTLQEEHRENYYTVMKSTGIDMQQYDFIRKKLLRFGMIDSKNEKWRDKNLDTIGDTMAEIIKQMNAKKPREVMAPKLEKMWTSQIINT